MTRRLLLLSNSTLHGSGYLDWAAAEIAAFLGGGGVRVAFVPYALYDTTAYAKQARERFAAIGCRLESVEQTADPAAAVASFDAIFVGGGNTFRLLDGLQRHGLVPAIRERVGLGTPYVGSSAGSIVACPTLQTTKDMPIVEPESFEALGLVSFQISPHYLDPDPSSTHMGETQEERILQYLEENDRPVAGLREGAMLRVEGDVVVLAGRAGARLFRRREDAVEARPIADVSGRLAPART